MRIFLLTALVMVAFAANSVLTRFAIVGGHIDPTGFAVVRVLSGAVLLALLVVLRGGRVPLLRRQQGLGAVTLAIYIIGFSLAYLTLDAGLGALILFGVVQIAMFAHGALFGVTPTPRKLLGAGVAFAGLVLVLWPSQGVAVDPLGAVLMIAAGLGWAAYTIIGRGASDPLAGSAGNFVICTPLVAMLLLVQPTFYSPHGHCSWRGLRGRHLGPRIRAVVCGAAKAGAGDGGGGATVGAGHRDSCRCAFAGRAFGREGDPCHRVGAWRDRAGGQRTIGSNGS